MKRNEIQNELKKLGCKELCQDNKTFMKIMKGQQNMNIFKR